MLIKNCNLISEGQKGIVDIHIENGVIKAIGPNLNIKDNEIIDAQSHLVIPGIIDAHCHFRDPGLTYKEDFLSGSQACAKGGVTTFIDMPNTKPQTTTYELLIDKINLAKQKSIVDFGFHFGAGSDNVEEIKKANHLVASTKIFFNLSTGDMMIKDKEALEKIYAASKMVSVHAEDESLDIAIQLAQQFNKPLNVCHVSSTRDISVCENAQRQGLNINVEVTPHHLLLNEDVWSNNKMMKHLLLTKPHIRTKQDNLSLWQAIKNNVISSIGTDHAPHLWNEKISEEKYGIPSIEFSLELMLKYFQAQNISLALLVELMCHQPARFFKIKHKGFIKQGYDGDLVIIDLNNQSMITNDEVVSKSKWSPYHGTVRQAKVLTTIVRGNVVYQNGVFNKHQGKEIEYEK